MISITDMLREGATNLWLFIPTAILLGALHGLEPGHSKTMMAAFIVAVRGTVNQAILLGLSATISHTAVVWAVALVGQYLGRNWADEATEPYFQLFSALLIIVIAVWMVWRIWREQRSSHDHHHHHHDEHRHIDTGHGIVALEIHEDGEPPRWHLRFESGERFAAADVTITTIRPDGTEQIFTMRQASGQNGDFYLESLDEIPEPHEFSARLTLNHGNHGHSYRVQFSEDHHHDPMDLGDAEDAHARAHADDIRRRFSGGKVTTGQIILFGLTGGLIPCPAAITVLLLCIQLKQLSLGFLLVLCFSIGLAITLVAAGVIAALSMRQIEKRWSGFNTFARRAPYFSAALIFLIGLYMAWHGWQGIMA